MPNGAPSTNHLGAAVSGSPEILTHFSRSSASIGVLYSSFSLSTTSVLRWVPVSSSTRSSIPWPIPRWLCILPCRRSPQSPKRSVSSPQKLPTLSRSFDQDSALWEGPTQLCEDLSSLQRARGMLACLLSSGYLASSRISLSLPSTPVLRYLTNSRFLWPCGIPRILGSPWSCLLRLWSLLQALPSWPEVYQGSLALTLSLLPRTPTWQFAWSVLPLVCHTLCRSSWGARLISWTSPFPQSVRGVDLRRGSLSAKFVVLEVYLQSVVVWNGGCRVPSLLQIRRCWKMRTATQGFLQELHQFWHMPGWHMLFMPTRRRVFQSRKAGYFNSSVCLRHGPDHVGWPSHQQCANVALLFLGWGQIIKAIRVSFRTQRPRHISSRSPSKFGERVAGEAGVVAIHSASTGIVEVEDIRFGSR